jgi:hypothetical protein
VRNATAAEAKNLGANAGKPKRMTGELVTDAIATPYLAEFGADMPGPARGEDWRARARHEGLCLERITRRGFSLGC